MNKLEKYTQEQLDFLKEWQGKATYKDITNMFNAEFNTSKSKEALRRRIGRGFTAWTSKYSDEQEEYIKKNLQIYSYDKVQKGFYEKFNIKITKQAISDRRRRVYNTEPTKASTKKDYRMYWAESELGGEYTDENRVLVKIKDEVRGGRGNWEYKHHLVWEKHYGKIPKGYRVLFLDSDTNNFDIDNLACVSLHQVCILASNNWFNKEREITLTALKYAELQIELK